MIDRILAGGCVITMDRHRRVIQDGAVAIHDGKIVCVGTSAEVLANYAANDLVDCRHQVIMPGFVDAHGHAGHAAFRFVVKDTAHWMPAMTHTYKHYVTDEFWYIEGRVSALERLKAGVTTAVSVMGSQPRCDDPIFSINHAKAYAEMGIRCIVCTGPCHVPWPHNFSRWVDGTRHMRAVRFDEVVSSLHQVIDALHNTNNGKTYAFVTPFGMVTSINPSGPTPFDQLTKLTEHDIHQAAVMAKVAKEHNTRIHTDCFGGMIQLAMQDPKHALLGPHVHVQHCSELSDEEVQVLADTGTHAAVAAYSRAPVHRMLDRGVNVAITSDGPNPGDGLDMLCCMRSFQSAYRIKANDGHLLPEEKLLEMTTIDAARAVGLDHLIGSLDVGKQADIITINMLSPRLSPTFNTVHAVVMSARGDDVQHVLVDGVFVMRDRVVPHVDEQAVLYEAQAEAERTIKRAGLEAFAYLEHNDFGQVRKPNRAEKYDLLWQRADGGHY